MSGRPPRRLELRASVALTFLTIAFHAAAAATLLALLPLIAGLCAASLLGVLGLMAVRERTLISAPCSPAALHLGYDGTLVVRLRNGQEKDAAMAARRYVSRWLVVIGLDRRIEGRHTILVARDMLAPEDFRQLRLWSLWGTLPATPDATAVHTVARTISSDTCL